MQIKLNNKMVEAEEVDILTSQEFWNEYQLADGKIIKTKNIAVAIYKTQEKDESGNNIYAVNGQSIIRVK